MIHQEFGPSVLLLQAKRALGNGSGTVGTGPVASAEGGSADDLSFLFIYISYLEQFYNPLLK